MVYYKLGVFSDASFAVTANLEIGEPNIIANLEIGEPNIIANLEIGEPNKTANLEIGKPNKTANLEIGKPLGKFLLTETTPSNILHFKVTCHT